MKNFKATLTFYAAVTLLMAVPFTLYPKDDGTSSYELHDGVIMRRDCDRLKPLPVKGKVLHMHHAEDGLYYIRIDQDNDKNGYIIGYIGNKGEGGSLETALLAGDNDSAIRRFLASAGIVHILIENKGRENARNTLYRLNLNDMVVVKREGVKDVIMSEGVPIMLEAQKDGNVLNLQDTFVPVMLGGEVRFQCLLDKRIIVITNGGDSEVVDIAARRSLYQYSSDVNYKDGTEYNLAISVIDSTDESRTDEGRLIFYKVFIDGIEAGRTDTGIAQLKRSYQLKVEENSYHLVRIERWELDPAGKRYQRVNNISQPRPVKLFIPGGRVIGVEITFNGTSYAVKTLVVVD